MLTDTIMVAVKTILMAPEFYCVSCGGSVAAPITTAGHVLTVIYYTVYPRIRAEGRLDPTVTGNGLILGCSRLISSSARRGYVSAPWSCPTVHAPSRCQ